MKTIILIAAIASLSILNPDAASAQAAIGEPGLYAFYHPEADVLQAGSRPYADPRDALALAPVLRPARRHAHSVRAATH